MKNVNRELLQYPLTVFQQRLWYEWLADPTSSKYNLAYAFELTGKLDITHLKKAWHAVVCKHESLRTYFSQELTNTHQFITSNLVNNFKIIDVINKDCAISTLTNIAKMPFDLTKPPLAWLLILRITSKQHILLLRIHHIVSDGHSIKMILRQLAANYNALTNGTLINSPQTLPSIKDYLIFAQNLMATQDRKHAKQFWQNYLARYNEPLTFPCPDSSNHRENTGGRYCLHFTINETCTIKQFIKQYHITPFIFFSAIYSIVLSQICDTTDVVFGYTSNNRPADFAQTCGFFVNLLPLRVKLSLTDSFISLLEQIKHDRNRVRHFDHYPINDIIKDFRKHQQDNTQLFNAALSAGGYNFIADDNLTLHSIDIKSLSINVGAVQNDLAVHYNFNNNMLYFLIDYNVNKLSMGFIKELSNAITIIINQAITSPTRSLKQFSLLNTQEQQKILFKWNDTAAKLKKPQTIHTLFELQAVKTPHNIAVGHNNETLTYQQLNAKANQLANIFRTYITTEITCIGICLDRSVNLIVSILAALKAGIGYMLLDPNFPLARLRYMLADPPINLLITHSKLTKKFDHFHGDMLLIDEIQDIIADQATYNLDVNICAQDLAYIIYTSGTTGKPKGIAINHYSLCNLALSQITAFNIKTTSRILQFAAVSFDAMVSEWTTALLSGARLQLLTSNMISADELINTINHYQISHITLTPSYLKLLPQIDMPSLTTLILAGEHNDNTLIKQWRNKLQLFNAYGPSEATVCATYANLSASTTIFPNLIGKPINNTRIYILNSRQQPLRPGMIGEIYIAGSGLAKSYVNQPILTREKFIYHRLINGVLERLYHSGDRGYYLNDGKIIFIGRNDDQIKIHGIRVELNEIANTINKFEPIRTSIVITQTNHQDDSTQLRAFLIKKSNSLLNNDELRHKLRLFLKQQLPHYMIPSYYDFVAKFPLSTNGKIDKQQLLNHFDSISCLQKHYRAPQTLTQWKLIKIWQDLLRHKPIGINDDFFALGGHSLLSIRLMAAFHQTFGIKFPINKLTQPLTIADLATYVDRHCSLSQQSILTYNHSSQQTPLFLIHPAYGLTFAYKALAKHLPTIPIHAINNPNFGSNKSIFNCIEDMADRYLKFIKTIQHNGPYRIGGWSFGGIVAFEIARQLHAIKQNTEIIMLIDSCIDTTFLNNNLLAEKLLQKYCRQTNINLNSPEGKLLQNEFDRSRKLLLQYSPKQFSGDAALLRCHQPVTLPYDRRSKDYGWGKIINRLYQHMIPGDHDTIFKEPNIGIVANTIANILTKHQSLATLLQP